MRLVLYVLLASLFSAGAIYGFAHRLLVEPGLVGAALILAGLVVLAIAKIRGRIR